MLPRPFLWPDSNQRKPSGLKRPCAGLRTDVHTETISKSADITASVLDGALDCRPDFLETAVGTTVHADRDCDSDQFAFRMVGKRVGICFGEPVLTTNRSFR